MICACNFQILGKVTPAEPKRTLFINTRQLSTLLNSNRILHKIVDDNGVMFSGTFSEMELAFNVMVNTTEGIMELYRFSESEAEKLQDEYPACWTGTLRFVEEISDEQITINQAI